VKRTFEKYISKENLLEIYTRDSENFDVGRVLGLDGQFVLLHAVSKYGRDEGLVLISLESVVSVQADSRYVKKAQRLWERYPSERQLPDVVGDDMAEFLLAYAWKEGLGISFELKSGNPEDYCGIILEYNEKIITLKQIGLYGEEDGVAYLRRDEIERMDCDDQQINGRLYCVQKN